MEHALKEPVYYFDKNDYLVEVDEDGRKKSKKTYAL